MYDDSVMSDSSGKDWCGKFTDGPADVHEIETKERHAVVTMNVFEKFASAPSRPLLFLKTGLDAKPLSYFQQDKDLARCPLLINQRGAYVWS